MELDFSEIIKLSVQRKNGAYLTEILQISIYPYSPEKVQFPSLIFWVNLIFPTRKLPHKANFTKIIYLSVQINLDKKVHLIWLEGIFLLLVAIVFYQLNFLNYPQITHKNFCTKKEGLKSS